MGVSDDVKLAPTRKRGSAPPKVGCLPRCPAARLRSADRCCDGFLLVLGLWADVAELRSSRGASFPCFRAARRAASDCMLLMRMRLRSDSVQRARETARLTVRVGVVPSKAPPPRERENFYVLLQQARLTSKSHPMASCATRTATCARFRGRTNWPDHRPLGPSGPRAKALEPSHPLISTFGVY